VALADASAVDHLVFDRVGEGSLIKWQLDRDADPARGYDGQTEEVARTFARHVAAGLTLIGSFGGANPEAAGVAAAKAFAEAGATGTKVGIVVGDDVRRTLTDLDPVLPELGRHFNEVADDVITANAYIGAEPIVDLLDQGARMILGGRLCDASLAVAAACHDLGWALDDWDAVAMTTLVGHLLTGGSGLTGGGFADPPVRVVPGLHDLGFGMAEVEPGRFTLSKLAGTGGMIRTDVVKSRIAYEITDPARYLTPDVAADLSQVRVAQVGDDRVEVSGITGAARPDTLRVLVGMRYGWKAVAQITYGGPGCVDRARLAEEVLRKRMEPMASEVEEFRCDLVGCNALFGDGYAGGPPAEVTVRMAARCTTQEAAAQLAEYGTYLYWGPAGGGAMEGRVEPAVHITDVLLPRASVPLSVEVVTA